MILDHINIRATDLAATRDFLVALLGLEDGFRPPFDFPGHWLYLEGHPIIHTSPRSTGPGLGWVDHVAFGPFDFDREKTRLDAGGFTYTVSGIPGTGIRQFFVQGPEGLKIELQCPERTAA